MNTLPTLFFAYTVVASISAAAIDGSEDTTDFLQSLNPGFVEDFDSESVRLFRHGTGGNRAEFTWKSGVQASVGSDAKVLRLSVDPEDRAGAWQGPNAVAVGERLFGYGSYAVSLKLPNVSELQPDVGIVAGFFTYLNDTQQTGQRRDWNQNGLPDNSEIDIEWLVADPEILYLTAYTDYDPQSGATRKVSRIVNLAKGSILSTEYAEVLGGPGVALSGVENQPETLQAIPGFDASARFYTYGFDWAPDRIHWWILHPETGTKVTLWDYRGPVARIPQRPAAYMINFWHTDNWPVVTNANSIEQPDHAFALEVDWASHVPFAALPEALERTLP